VPFPPELFIIGAQKAGTTFLANLLGQNPEICVAEPKEPDFLTRHHDKGESWYASCFSNPSARHLLDASTSYAASPLSSVPDPHVDRNTPLAGVPQRLHDLSPGAKLIYLLRNPVNRTYSSYWHNVRAGHEGRPFREALSGTSFYLRVSRYYDQLELYLDYFPRESILLLLFEDLVSEPVKTVRKCLGLLDLPPMQELNVEVGQNRSFVYRSGLGSVNRMAARWGGVNRVLKPIGRNLPKAWIGQASKVLTRRVPKIQEADRNYLLEYFARENEKLSRHFGMSLAAWERAVP
jgi:Sulfotransferase family